MSWGSDAANAASSTGSAAGTASTAGNAADAASLYGNMADVSGTATPTTGSYDFGTPNPSTGPTTSAGDMQTYGTADPSLIDKGVNAYERFQKGGSQSLADTYKNFGNNPETYGAVVGGVQKVAGMGKQAGPAPITMNISNQQAQNDYLLKRFQQRRY